MARRPTERGAGTLEVVLVTPLLLMLVAVVIQFALWYHASHVAIAAAADGLRAAQAEGASAASGRDRAASELDQLGRDLVLDREVSASRTADVARVEIRGHAPELLPGLRLPIRAVSVGPVERFRSAEEGK